MTATLEFNDIIVFYDVITLNETDHISTRVPTERVCSDVAVGRAERRESRPMSTQEKDTSVFQRDTQATMAGFLRNQRMAKCSLYNILITTDYSIVEYMTEECAVLVCDIRLLDSFQLTRDKGAHDPPLQVHP
ncbi:hypothetical protein CBL_04883 [Carabus blaptoides fortunei]